ncbi:MAG: efflux RND transporter periplasmic adaptor subunit [Pseudomonadota bacterium]
MAALPVQAGTVRYQDGYRVDQRFLGRVRPRRESRLGFEQAGRVVGLMVEEGERVGAGAVLARLDTAALEAERATAEAALDTRRSAYEVAESALALAEATFERTAELMRSRNVSRQRFDEAASAAQIARGQLALAEAQQVEALARLAEAELAIARATLSAPFAGSVVARLIDEGTVVAPAQPVLHLAETEALEVRVGVPEEVAERLEIGASYRLALGDREMAAPLRAILTEMTPDSRTVPVVLALPEGIDAPAGSLASLIVQTQRTARGFWMPIEALSSGPRGLWTALALTPDPAPETSATEALHRLSERALVLLHHDGARAFVRGTFEEGERFVAAGRHRLVAGQRVRLQAETP